MTSDEIQLERFKQAVELLGGMRSGARALGISERTMGRLLAGTQNLHAGFLQDTAQALLEHADKCRHIERQISPAFVENLTQDQLEKRPHGNTERRGEKRPRQLPERIAVVKDEPVHFRIAPGVPWSENSVPVERWIDGTED